MSNINVPKAAGLSRRNLLRVVATGGALIGAGMAAGAAQAQNKIAQKTVNYQPTPKGKAQCDNCVQFQAPNACKLVQGPISPSGWCSVYAPKPKA